MDKNCMFYEIEAYMKHLVFAHNCLQAYMCLLRNIEQHNDILNEAPGFFTITKYSLSKCAVLEFAKLFKNSSKEKTICKLINVVKANNNLFSNGNAMKLCAIAEEKLFTEFESVILKLKVRRDKDLGHNDKEYFHNDRNPALENYISLRELETLYNFAMNFCNELLNALQIETTIVLENGADDLDDLINKYCK